MADDITFETFETNLRQDIKMMPECFDDVTTGLIAMYGQISRPMTEDPNKTIVERVNIAGIGMQNIDLLRNTGPNLVCNTGGPHSLLKEAKQLFEALEDLSPHFIAQRGVSIAIEKDTVEVTVDGKNTVGFLNDQNDVWRKWFKLSLDRMQTLFEIYAILKFANFKLSVVAGPGASATE
eukprot:a509838_1730.p1 GENE.a509838_1730~~a509838_1730.p1  ORF type:complete len:190 (+),score=7.10 a509838_1730:34-570(+)